MPLRFMGKWINLNNRGEVTDQTFDQNMSKMYIRWKKGNSALIYI